MEDMADWTYDEEIDLFANLDNLAQTNRPTRLSHLLSEEEFLNRLQESLANPRPRDQIKDKLQEHVEGSFDHVYVHGTRNMKLDADTRRAVEARLVEIRLSSPRQLRSNSRKRLHSDRLSVTPASSRPAKSRRLKSLILRADSTDRVRISQWSQKLLLIIQIADRKPKFTEKSV